MDKNNASITAEEVKSLLSELGGRPIAFHRSYVRVGGSINAALMLSQAMHWSKNEAAIARGGWFYKTSREWEAETGLTRREQETARKKLKERGLLEEELRHVPAKLYYRVNLDRLAELLLAEATDNQEKTSLAEECAPAPMSQADAQNRLDDGGKRQTITKRTSQNTSERTYKEDKYKYLSDLNRSRVEVSFSDKNCEPEDESEKVEVYSSVKEVMPSVTSAGGLVNEGESKSLTAPKGRTRDFILTDKTNDRVLPVYEYWLRALKRYRSRSPLTDEARYMIAARLNDGFTENELKLAVLGCILSLDIRDFYIVRDDDGEPRMDKVHPKLSSLKHIFSFKDRVQKFIDIAVDEWGVEVSHIDKYDWPDFGCMYLDFDGDTFWDDLDEYCFEYDESLRDYADEEDYYMMKAETPRYVLAA